MLNIRAQIEKTKQFVKEHPTLTGCAVTALVTAKVVHDKDVDRLKSIAAELLFNETERFAMLTDATSYIDMKGLTDEFYAFAPRLRD